MVTLAVAKPECLTLRLSRPVTRLLLRTPLTPNQVTAGNLMVGLAALAGFAMGGIRWGVAGALLLQVYTILDHCDGE
ncbi:MAG: CDP-alcohol phosphatidyltransferase family protein, partial [Candidatus Methylomirabilales bacterium]